MKKTLLLLTFLVFGFTQAQTIIYVDVDATGANNGSSWANAYTSLHSALGIQTITGAQIWIAEGTYMPVNKNTPMLNQYGVSIYGGFVGTETSLSQRSTDPWAHPVYLTGDLALDDANELSSATSANKTDNAPIILKVEPNSASKTQEITLDRLHFVNSYGGSALYSHPSSSNEVQRKITVQNCRFSRNYASTRPAMDIWSNETVNDYPFELFNSILDENVSNSGYAFEYRITNYINLEHDIFIANNMFIGNKVETANASGSVARFISATGGSTRLNVYFQNNTLTLNEEGSNVTSDVASPIRFETVGSAETIGFWGNNLYFSNYGTSDYIGTQDTSSSTISTGYANASEFTPVIGSANLLTNYTLSESPFVDIFSGDFIPISAYRDNGEATHNYGYYSSFNPTTDCFMNPRRNTDSSIGLGAIQYTDTAMLTGPGNIAPLSLPEPPTVIYVDANATGANDGTSWTNAYTSLDDANIPTLGSGSKIFVKSGTYKLTSGEISINSEIEIYGGFNGTETSETDRDLSIVNTSNATIISGDILDDDISGDFTQNKSDNSSSLFNLAANNVIIDGFVLSNYYTTSGSPIVKVATNVSNFELSNTLINNNYSNSILFDWRTFSGTVSINNVTITDNQTNNGLILLQHNDTNSSTLESNWSNVLVANNTYNADWGAIWFRRGTLNNDGRLFKSSLTNVSIIDNVNNHASTQQVINVSSGSGWGVFEFRNSLFWQNKYNGGQLSTVDIENSKTAEGDIQTVRVYNTIAMVGSGVTSGTFDNSNITLLDPTTDNLNLDAEYKPTSASNYIVDQGDNAYYDEALFGDLDLSGNTRVFNTTIDLGAYEYNSTLGIDDVSFNTNTVKLYPNPVSDRLFIKSTEQVKNISIYNINGQLVKQASETTSGIDVSVLPSGLYMIEINTSNNSINQKFLKD